MADLEAFLKDMARRPFVWGEHDCSLILADWWLANHGGEDPAAELRGTYANEEECHALLDDHGGLLGMVRDMAFDVGALPREGNPEPGDFGVMEAAGTRFGVICTPTGRWATKALTGITVTSREPLMVWAI